MVRKASELANLQSMGTIKEKFVQRFHWQHAAVKGMFRFMDDLQHYQTFNKDTSVEKAGSDVSSEHFMNTVGPFTASGLHGADVLIQEEK